MTNMEIAKTIKQQLTYGSTNTLRVMSWGANAWTVIDKGLAFKVQGFKLKGVVKITLTSMDDYTIEFIKGRLTTESVPYKKVERIYFDEMVDIIDCEVEFTGKDYEQRVINAKYNF